MFATIRMAHWLVAGATTAAMLVLFALAMNHPINADLAMLHYSAWLINERDFVVYRDIFELNLPAPFLFHALLGKLLGYAALPLRFVDIALFAVLMRACWVILSPLSRPAALLAPALFSLLYLCRGGEYVLERDYLALLPTVLAFAVALQPASRPLVTGALAAIACSMKPNAVVVVPVLLWLCYRKTPGAAVANMGRFFTAMTITAAIPFLWVVYQGGLDAFVAIYRDFVPIYANSRYDLWHYANSSERLTVLLHHYLQYGGAAAVLSLPGLLWSYWLFRGNPPQQQRIIAIGLMTLSFTFYEVIAGKFWLNHMFPSALWVCLCISLLLCQPKPAASRLALALALLLPAIPAAITWPLGKFSLEQMHDAWQQERETPDAWRARRVAHALQQYGLSPDDKVQVLDMAGDGQAALLLAHATTATRHLIDVPLYMQPESVATQSLRQEMVDALNASPPRFVVYFEGFLHPGGGNRLKEFRPLYALLEQQYEIVQQADGEYTIYRHK